MALEPRLIQGLQAEYIPATLNGAAPGLQPYGKNIIVRVDQASQITSGGVSLPLDMVERMSEAAATGCIVSKGPEAFRLFDDGTRWQGPVPEVGDRIYFEKFAGVLARGMDGNVYRIMDYRAVAAGLTEEAKQALAAA